MKKLILLSLLLPSIAMATSTPSIIISNHCPRLMNLQINPGTFENQVKDIPAFGKESFNFVSHPSSGNVLVITNKKSVPYHWLFQFWPKPTILMLGNKSSYKVSNRNSITRIILKCKF